MKSPHDYPIMECFDAASRFVADGATIYQKFSCESCGARMTIPDANTFYTSGSCEKCRHVSNIRKNGCNYMLAMDVGQPRTDRIMRMKDAQGSGTIRLRWY